jgi:hypothetical protein
MAAAAYKIGLLLSEEGLPPSSDDSNGEFSEDMALRFTMSNLTL